MPTSNIIPKTSRSGTRKSRRGKCDNIPKVKDVLYQYQCPEPDCCKVEAGKVANDGTTNSDQVSTKKPPGISIWSWKLKQQQYGAPPLKSQFRTAKFRWDEKLQEKQPAENDEEEDCPERKFINPFGTRAKSTLSGAQKRKIVEKWGKMWDSALSDLRYDRKVFENNPDGEQIYKSDNERINDGCQKLCAIAKMNQNIITMMMKKFVSGPTGKLYTLNRIEAAQCWSRIINDRGLVNDFCCVDLPLRPSKEKVYIPALKTPKAMRKKATMLKEMSMFRLPSAYSLKAKKSKKPVDNTCTDKNTSKGVSNFKKNPTFWLDPKTVPPCPPGFREDEFEIDPKGDPTGEIRRDLRKAKERAKRYTRFAHIIEKAAHVIPNLDKMNKAMDEHFVAKDPMVRRQTLLHNFFASPKMETSPDFKKDAVYATILSRNDNPKGAVSRKPFPYSLAEMPKFKSKENLSRM